MKVYALPADERWICDAMVDQWERHSGMSTRDASEADVLWLLSEWRWKSVPRELLESKPVVCTVHHLMLDEPHRKFDQADWDARDPFVDVYTVYNERELAKVRSLTNKPVQLVPYWVDDTAWFQVDSRSDLRRKHGVAFDAFTILSAQRDSEGADLTKPKWEKGPAEFCDAVEHLHRQSRIHEVGAMTVLLAGWRRDFVIKRLTDAKVPHLHIERPPQEALRELYSLADEYWVTSNIEGGPQALLEAGACGLAVRSRPVGIAEQVLPASAIHDDVTKAVASVPDVERFKVSKGGMEPWKALFRAVVT